MTSDVLINEFAILDKQEKNKFISTILKNASNIADIWLFLDDKLEKIINSLDNVIDKEIVKYIFSLTLNDEGYIEANIDDILSLIYPQIVNQDTNNIECTKTQHIFYLDKLGFQLSNLSSRSIKLDNTFKSRIFSYFIIIDQTIMFKIPEQIAEYIFNTTFKTTY